MNAGKWRDKTAMAAARVAPVLLVEALFGGTPSVTSARSPCMSWSTGALADHEYSSVASFSSRYLLLDVLVGSEHDFVGVEGESAG